MKQTLQKGVMGVAAVCAIAVGSAVVANAASGGGSASNSTSNTVAAANSGATGQQGVGPPGGPGSDGHGPGETLLTGSKADTVTAAAKDKVPGGTILRVETDSGPAAYEAHVQKSDGSQVVVLFDKDLKVTGVQDFGGPGQRP